MIDTNGGSKLDRVLDLVAHPRSDPELIEELAQPDSEARELVEGLQTIAEVTDPANFRVPGEQSDLDYPPLESIKPPKSLVRRRIIWRVVIVVGVVLVGALIAWAIWERVKSKRFEELFEKHLKAERTLVYIPNWKPLRQEVAEMKKRFSAGQIEQLRTSKAFFVYVDIGNPVWINLMEKNARAPTGWMKIDMGKRDYWEVGGPVIRAVYKTRNYLYQNTFVDGLALILDEDFEGLMYVYNRGIVNDGMGGDPSVSYERSSIIYTSEGQTEVEEKIQTPPSKWKQLNELLKGATGVLKYEQCNKTFTMDTGESLTGRHYHIEGDIRYPLSLNFVEDGAEEPDGWILWDPRYPFEKTDRLLFFGTSWTTQSWDEEQKSPHAKPGFVISIAADFEGEVYVLHKDKSVHFRVEVKVVDVDELKKRKEDFDNPIPHKSENSTKDAEQDVPDRSSRTFLEPDELEDRWDDGGDQLRTCYGYLLFSLWLDGHEWKYKGTKRILERLKEATDEGGKFEDKNDLAAFLSDILGTSFIRIDISQFYELPAQQKDDAIRGMVETKLHTIQTLQRTFPNLDWRAILTGAHKKIAESDNKHMEAIMADVIRRSFDD